MRDSSNLIRELEQERASLAVQRGNLVSEAEGMREKIASIDTRLQAIDVLLGAPQVTIKNRIVHELKSWGNLKGHVEHESEGLRASIRHALKDLPKGLKPKEITEELRSSGVVVKGKTPLKIRVANELHRMLSKSVFRKNGRYILMEFKVPIRLRTNRPTPSQTKGVVE